MRPDVKLNCCPSERRQNYLIRDNHLPVANELGYATSSKISASILQIFLYSLLTDFLMFSRECIMSSRFGLWIRWVFSGPSLKNAVSSLQACRPVVFAIVLLRTALIMMGIVWKREACRASFAYAYVFSNFVRIFGVTYLFC